MSKLITVVIAFSLTAALSGVVCANEPTPPTPAAAPTDAAPAASTTSTQTPDARDANTGEKPAAHSPDAKKQGESQDALADAKKADADPVVCRKMDVFGSRVRKQKVCMTRSEWANQKDETQRALRDANRRNSTQPGGESLQTSGH
jgi:hypothetical protein